MEANVFRLEQIRQSLFANETYLEYVDGEYPVDCKCPMCGKTHRVVMFWTGRGVPRKYCSHCKGGAQTEFGTNTLSMVGGPDNVSTVAMTA
jgi:transposase-like protein